LGGETHRHSFSRFPNCADRCVVWREGKEIPMTGEGIKNATTCRPLNEVLWPNNQQLAYRIS